MDTSLLLKVQGEMIEKMKLEIEHLTEVIEQQKKTIEGLEFRVDSLEELE